MILKKLVAKGLAYLIERAILASLAAARSTNGFTPPSASTSGTATPSANTLPATPSQWPHPSQDAMRAFYGDPSGDNGQASTVWEHNNLVSVSVPEGLDMKLAWDTATPVHKIRCHHKVAASLTRILAAAVHLPEAERNVVCLYAGAYNYRANRGNNTILSTHAYGAAIDIDSEHNPYHSTGGTMPASVVALFEKEGWLWGGRFVHGRDPMHFQATAPYQN